MGIFSVILNFLSGGVVDRVLDSIDTKIKTDAEKDKLKADIIREHMRTRPDWLRAGGFWTLMVVLVPAAYHYAAVALYSVHWCQDCANPQPWSIAAMPPPMDQYQGWIILAAIGGLGLFRWRK